MLRINIADEVPTMCVLQTMEMKFTYHVPTIYVYRKRSSLKDIENNIAKNVPTMYGLPMNLFIIKDQ